MKLAIKGQEETKGCDVNGASLSAGAGSAELHDLHIWRTLSNNKLVVSFVMFMVTSLLAWGVWTTTLVFDYKAFAGDQEKDVEQVERKLEDIDKEQRKIREEQKEDNQKILEILIQIQRDINNR